jgi:hypothetical protein
MYREIKRVILMLIALVVHLLVGISGSILVSAWVVWFPN